VYPQWIKSGKLDAGEAHDQLRAMEAIVKTLMRLDAEQRQLSLFTTHPEDPACPATCAICKLAFAPRGQVA